MQAGRSALAIYKRGGLVVSWGQTVDLPQEPTFCPALCGRCSLETRGGRSDVLPSLDVGCYTKERDRWLLSLCWRREPWKERKNKPCMCVTVASLGRWLLLLPLLARGAPRKELAAAASVEEQAAVVVVKDRSQCPVWGSCSPPRRVTLRGYSCRGSGSDRATAASPPRFC